MKWWLGLCMFVPIMAWAGPEAVTAQDARHAMDKQLDALYGSHAEYYAFFDRLQKEVGQRRKQQVAQMVHYPITVSMTSGKRRVIYNTMQFVKLYDQIVSPEVEAAVHRQTYETLFARDTGLMVGNGEVWFSGVCDRMRSRKHMNCTVKIIGINHLSE